MDCFNWTQIDRRGGKVNKLILAAIGVLAVFVTAPTTGSATAVQSAPYATRQKISQMRPPANGDVIEISDISKWDSDFLNDFVKNGGRIIFSGDPGTINGPWWLERAQSIIFKIADIHAWSGEYLTAFVDKGGRIVYSGDPGDINGEWWIDHAKSLTIVVRDISRWNQDFLRNFSNHGGRVIYREHMGIEH